MLWEKWTRAKNIISASDKRKAYLLHAFGVKKNGQNQNAETTLQNKLIHFYRNIFSDKEGYPIYKQRKETLPHILHIHIETKIHLPISYFYVYDIIASMVITFSPRNNVWDTIILKAYLSYLSILYEPLYGFT